jgi:peptide deformylase
MAVLPIRIWGEPVLHEAVAPVTVFDATLRTLVADMFDTMDAAPGVGLAGPQAGVGLRLFVWSYADQEDGPARGVAINPTLWISPTEPGEPDEDDEEGCLSFPGERFPLRRAEEALLRATDLDGAPFELHAHGWFARVLQHEYDHLDGFLYVDRLEHPWSKQASKAARKNSWGGPGQSWLPGVDLLEGP